MAIKVHTLLFGRIYIWHYVKMVPTIFHNEMQIDWLTFKMQASAFIGVKKVHNL